MQYRVHLIVIVGDATVDELMTRLIQDHEVFAEQQQGDIEQEVRNCQIMGLQSDLLSWIPLGVLLL